MWRPIWGQPSWPSGLNLVAQASDEFIASTEEVLNNLDKTTQVDNCWVRGTIYVVSSYQGEEVQNKLKVEA
jgi:hypothetical protein